MNPTGSKKTAIVFTLFVLIVLPLLVFMVGKQVRLRPRAGGGTDPRAQMPSTLIFPYVPLNSLSPIVGGDRDQHGCIPSAGYSWCASLNKCIRPWEETCSGAIVEPGPMGGGGSQPALRQAQVETKLVLQNISYETSHVTVSLISSDGTQTNSQSVQIPGLGQKEISFSPRMAPTVNSTLPGGTPGPVIQNAPVTEGGGSAYPYNYSSGVYSAVVSSDKGIRGVAQIMQTGGGNFSSDSYQGYLKSEVSKKWFFTSRLGGEGRNQKDQMSFMVALKNPNPMPATYSIIVYSLEGTLVYSSRGVVPGNGADYAGAYAFNQGELYGSVVIESDQDLFAEGVLKSDMRLSFLRGSADNKNGFTVPFPFNDAGSKCDIQYSDPRPYCGVPTLLVFNPNPNTVRVDLAKNGSESLKVSKDLNPHAAMMYKMARTNGDVGSYSINAQSGVVASVIFESDVYWDTAFTIEEPLADQYLPLWSRYKYPFKTTTEVVVINPTNKEVMANVDFFDQFGQLATSEEKTIPAFKKANYSGSYTTNAQFGSARVRSYLPGDKGPGAGVPVLAYIVGGQEVTGSTGALLSGDGAFVYSGVGYEGPNIGPSPIAVSTLGRGWNKVDTGKVFPGPECGVRDQKVGGKWNFWQSEINNEPTRVGMINVDFPSYVRCGDMNGPIPTILPIPWPRPTASNLPYPITSNPPYPTVTLDKSAGRCGDLGNIPSEQNITNATFGAEGSNIRFSGVIPGVSLCDKFSASVEVGISASSSERQIKVNITNMGHQGMCAECIAQNSFSGFVSGLGSGSYYFKLVYKGASMAEGGVQLP